MPCVFDNTQQRQQRLLILSIVHVCKTARPRQETDDPFKIMISLKIKSHSFGAVSSTLALSSDFAAEQFRCNVEELAEVPNDELDLRLGPFKKYLRSEDVDTLESIRKRTRRRGALKRTYSRSCN